MRAIRGVALGTYYAAGANAAKTTPHASPMRGMVYAVKDNRDPPNPKQLVAHPFHPSPRPVLVDRTNAIEYVTAILGRRISRLTRFFGADDPRAITGAGDCEDQGVEAHRRGDPARFRADLDPDAKVRCRRPRR